MSLTGVKFRAYPSTEQKLLLSQWMGCARFIWNAKCDEQEYFYKFKQKFCSINIYPPVDQAYAQFKSKENSPWLFDCPSVLLRNVAYTWKNTFSNFLKGSCGKPKKKRKGSSESIWLTSEIFSFEDNKLLIGSQKHNLGELKFKGHRPFNNPKSIRIKKESGKYYVSFCYDTGIDSELVTQKEHLQHLSGASRSELEQSVIGIDRGVKIAVHTGEQIFNPPKIHELRKSYLSKNIKRLQRKLSRQVKGSNHRQKTKERIKKNHESIANMRREFAHQTSYKLVNSDAKVLVFEDLKTKQMTKRAKPKTDARGNFLKNNKRPNLV